MFYLLFFCSYLIVQSEIVFIESLCFNVQENETILSEFLNTYNAKNIVKNKTCFKSVKNPSCVVLTVTDKPGSFQHTNVFETGILDHHKQLWKQNLQRLRPSLFITAITEILMNKILNKSWEVNWKLMLLMQIMRIFTMSTLMYLMSMLP